MGKLKPKPGPDLYKRARGYGLLNQLHERQAMENDPNWKPVPGFPEYEVTELRQIRRKSTGAPIHPYQNSMRPNEGEFVDFWISGQRHAIAMSAIMSAAFPKEK